MWVRGNKFNVHRLTAPQIKAVAFIMWLSERDLISLSSGSVIGTLGFGS